MIQKSRYNQQDGLGHLNIVTGNNYGSTGLFGIGSPGTTNTFPISPSNSNEVMLFFVILSLNLSLFVWLMSHTIFHFILSFYIYVWMFLLLTIIGTCSDIVYFFQISNWLETTKHILQGVPTFIFQSYYTLILYFKHNVFVYQKCFFILRFN